MKRDWTEQDNADIAAANHAAENSKGTLVIGAQHAFATELRLRGWELEKAVQAMWASRWGSDGGKQTVDDYYATLQAYRARGYNAPPEPNHDWNERLPVASENEAQARRPKYNNF